MLRSSRRRRGRRMRTSLALRVRKDCAPAAAGDRRCCWGHGARRSSPPGSDRLSDARRAARRLAAQDDAAGPTCARWPTRRRAVYACARVARPEPPAGPAARLVSRPRRATRRSLSGGRPAGAYVEPGDAAASRSDVRARPRAIRRRRSPAPPAGLQAGGGNRSWARRGAGADRRGEQRNGPCTLRRSAVLRAHVAARGSGQANPLRLPETA